MPPFLRGTFLAGAFLAAGFFDAALAAFFAGIVNVLFPEFIYFFR